MADENKTNATMTFKGEGVVVLPNMPVPPPTTVKWITKNDATVEGPLVVTFVSGSWQAHTGDFGIKEIGVGFFVPTGGRIEQTAPGSAVSGYRPY